MGYRFASFQAVDKSGESYVFTFSAYGLQATAYWMKSTETRGEAYAEIVDLDDYDPKSTAAQCFNAPNGDFKVLTDGVTELFGYGKTFDGKKFEFSEGVFADKKILAKVDAKMGAGLLTFKFTGKSKATYGFALVPVLGIYGDIVKYRGQVIRIWKDGKTTMKAYGTAQFGETDD